jgi:GT2 family glycosyltransferase
LEIPIVILYYNKVSLTESCIDSVLKAGHAPSRIYCFNNGSRRNFSSLIQAKYPRLNHLDVEHNIGFSGGFNHSLRKVFQQGHSAVFFLTNDTTIDQSTVPNAYQKANATGSGMVAPCVKYAFNPDKIHSIGAYFSHKDYHLYHYQTFGLEDSLNSGFDYIPGTALFITKETFTELAGTDENYFMYWEDADLCFRAHRAGIKLSRAYDSTVYHGVGKTCHKKALYTSYYFNRNRILFVKRFLRGEQLIKAMTRIKGDLKKHLERHTLNKDQQRINFLRKIIREEI